MINLKKKSFILAVVSSTTEITESMDVYFD